MATRDKRALGQAGSLSESGVDFERLRRERLGKVQSEMVARDIDAMLLTDIINIRYATGLAVMPLYNAVNLAHYVLLPAEGEPVVFEDEMAMFRASEFYRDVRPTRYWQARFSDPYAERCSSKFAAEITDILQSWGAANSRVAVDILDYYGFEALSKQGLRLTDADEPMEAARIIKTRCEIELLRQAAAVAEAALYEMERAIQPGISENALMGIYWKKMLELGGEYCFTRLLVSGYKTNPWFHEAGSKLVRPGDLVGIDADMVGPEGYCCDISRTFLCGSEPTPVQQEAYRVAHDFIQETIELCRVGTRYADFAAAAPSLPDPYLQQRYPSMLHGIGTDDEPPFIPFPAHGDYVMPEGALHENMVVCVECYAGKPGEQDGVKLEDEVWITAKGPVVLSLYPYAPELLG